MTNQSRLGRMEELNLRCVWGNEAKSFTPWLAENLSELGNAIGIELELEDQEARTGSFSLDLLARIAETNRTVIIENQLEQTDHDHLGKLLTYAGGFDAHIIIWVAKSIRDEHKLALEWLNHHTDDDTDFFGVVVKAYSIEGSIPAPHFSVVVAPNEWQREADRRIRTRKASDRNIKYQEFFQGLIDRLREKNFTQARKGQPQNWYLFSAGHGNRFQYGVNFTKENFVSVHVYIDHTNKDWNKAVFSELYKHKNSIESDFSEPLEWNENEDRRFSRIAVVRPGSIDDDGQILQELQDWVFDRLLSLERVFGPRLKELDTV